MPGSLEGDLFVCLFVEEIIQEKGGGGWGRRPSPPIGASINTQLFFLVVAFHRRVPLCFSQRLPELLEQRPHAFQALLRAARLSQLLHQRAADDHALRAPRLDQLGLL